MKKNNTIDNAQCVLSGNKQQQQQKKFTNIRIGI